MPPASAPSRLAAALNAITSTAVSAIRTGRSQRGTGTGVAAKPPPGRARYAAPSDTTATARAPTSPTPIAPTAVAATAAVTHAAPRLAGHLARVAVRAYTSTNPLRATRPRSVPAAASAA